MLINIITPHVGAFIGIILSGFKRCWDRKCTCDKKRTRRRVQEDYEMLYMGPDFLIEIRYSQIISSFYIIMIYSAGLPFLYLLAMVQTFVLYWVDKYLCKQRSKVTIFVVLRLYRTPPRYGPEMADVTRRVMTYAIFIHFAFAFYMYSNS